MKWEAFTLLCFFVAYAFTHARRFTMDMSVLVDPIERSRTRMSLAIVMIVIGVLIGCVLRLAQ